jgi:PKD repeat protein
MLNRIAFFAVLAIGFIACEPSEAGHTELGALPQADYTMTYIDSNNVQFTSNSTGDPFLFSWDIEGVGTYTGETVDVFIGSIGVYNVKHTVFNQGGSASTTGTVEIYKEGPPPCVGAMEWLTECSQRTWKIAPQAGALWVGSDDGVQWWAIDATGPTARPCTFNDEWTFEADGDMVYNSNGDFWGEPVMGFSPEGCFTESDFTASQEGWKSGTHGFEIIPATATSPEQLKVTGTGAFIGLHKVANDMEVGQPISAIIYDIVSMTEIDGDRYMEIDIDYGPGRWRFTLYSES